MKISIFALNILNSIIFYTLIFVKEYYCLEQNWKFALKGSIAFDLIFFIMVLVPRYGTRYINI